MTGAAENLFTRLGGAEGIARIVDAMYARILADDELAPFFRNVDTQRVRRMQYQFMASALDGPVAYTGADLTRIHAGRGITAYHFSRFCGHFVEAMEEAGVAAQEIDAALGRLAMYKDTITGESTVDG